MKNFITLCAQYCIPQHLATRLMGWLCHIKVKSFKNWQINHLISKYGANLEEAKLQRLEDYPTFNSFFTRELKPGVRPIDQQQNHLVSPVDGKIYQVGQVTAGKLIQAKGREYSLQALLTDLDLAEKFASGEHMTIYLAPKDYHRVHMPFTGTLKKTIYVPGKLFSVSPLTTAKIENLFARNERLICEFTTEFGPMLVIFVGAFFVGSIHTVWQGPVNQHFQRQPITKNYQDILIQKGQPLGHFAMGSTIILLTPKGSTTWLPNSKQNQILKMGTDIGQTSAYLIRN